MTTVIARLAGGLGNQLFIYAAARALALRHGAGLLLDIRSGFRRDVYRRRFTLDRFPIEGRVALGNETWYLPLFSLRGLDRPARWTLGKLNDRLPSGSRFFLAESPGREPVRTDAAPGTVYLDGYWQDERHFKDAERTIRRELVPPVPDDPQALELGRRMRSGHSVAVHARRLYYVPAGVRQPNPGGESLPPGYYQRAVERIAAAVPDPVFYCCGDDPQWLRENFRCPYPVLFPAPSADPGGDLRDFWLMTQCRHHIVANSTFSWWSAWLSEGAEKRVVCPEFTRFGQPAATPPEWQVVPLP